MLPYLLQQAARSYSSVTQSNKYIVSVKIFCFFQMSPLIALTTTISKLSAWLDTARENMFVYL